MKIYTKTGDDGTTGLIGGRRVRKDDARLACCGTIDELNACLGLAGAGAGAELTRPLGLVQAELFIIGSHLAAPEGKLQGLPPLTEENLARLEQEIDSAEADLPPLRNFILPGGSETAARLHLARTICRRAERSLVQFAATHPVEPILLTYLNRLSDWLFVQARLANQRAGVADVPWNSGKSEVGSRK
jgi:cob(I)alamin adenosyltransferase